MQIHTITDLIEETAKALLSRDVIAVEQLMSVSDNWLQPESERDAQQLLLHAVLEATCLLEGEESEIELTQ